MLKLFLVLVTIQQCIGIADVEFYLYRRGDSSKLSTKTLPANFDRNKPTYVLLHGMGGSSQDGCIKNLMSALLQMEDANVIVPDYYRAAFYYTMLYQDIAQQISNFLKVNNVQPLKTTAIGQSLGAQVAGVMSSYGYKPNLIMGMDPAGPQFSGFPDYMKLSPNSANHVQVVHTNVGQLGSTTQDGHLDVYINRGSDFPCCSSSVCRHTGACNWTANTIRSGPVLANTCASQANAMSGTCSRGLVLSGFGAPIAQGRTVAHLELSKCVPRN